MARSLTQGFVYLIKSHQKYHQSGLKLFKIGCSSRSPETRIQALQIGQPFRLEIIKTVETYDMWGLEWRLHRLFKHRRLSGEWFALSQKDIGTFNKYIESSPVVKNKFPVGVLFESRVK